MAYNEIVLDESILDIDSWLPKGALDRRLTPQPHDNMYSDMYEYSFRKVL